MLDFGHWSVRDYVPFRHQIFGPNCHLTREYKNAFSILATSPNAEGLKTNHHNNVVSFSSDRLNRLFSTNVDEQTTKYVIDPCLIEVILPIGLPRPLATEHPPHSLKNLSRITLSCLAVERSNFSCTYPWDV